MLYIQGEKLMTLKILGAGPPGTCSTTPLGISEYLMLPTVAEITFCSLKFHNGKERCHCNSTDNHGSKQRR